MDARSICVSDGAFTVWYRAYCVLVVLTVGLGGLTQYTADDAGVPGGRWSAYCMRFLSVQHIHGQLSYVYDRYSACTQYTV